MHNSTDIATLTIEILDLARARGWKITTAESCTGGLLAAALTEIAGASDVFDRGFVTYSNQAKQQMLGVSTQSLHDFGAVSQQVAREMAQGALQNAGADLGLSITGIAGPGGSEFKPEGRVCFGVSQKDAADFSQTVEFGAVGRAVVRQRSVRHALDLILHALRTT